MAVVKILDDVTAWAQEVICNKVKLKAPPDDDADAVDKEYTYTLVTPTAFTLFVPTKDKMPPDVVAPIPSLCVRFIEGTENLDGTDGSIAIQFAFSTWDVGLHGKDLFKMQEDGTFQRMSDEQAKDYFQRSYEGWRDAWNFVDVALREIKNRTIIAGYQLDPLSPIEYGPLADQEAIPDYYPYWFCWVNFRLKYPVNRNVKDFVTYL